MLQAGKLRHRVVLQRQQEAQNNDNGAVDVTWIDIATLWASIEPISAREFVASEAEASKVTTRITIRNRDITAKMRFYHAAKDAYYNIEGILADKESGLEYITCPCSEGLRWQEGEPDAVIPVNLIDPVITGTAIVGQIVTVNTGSWANDAVSYTYKWYRNGIAIPGQTTNSLVVPNNVGNILTAGVIGINTAGSGVESITVGKVIS